MPLPESTDLSYMHDEFIELLWDNGPVMQGQSNKTRKSSMFTALSCDRDKDSSKDNPYPKIGHFRAVEPKLNSFSPPESSAAFGINAQDDDIVPWMNYPMEDHLHSTDYCSELLDDYPGINLNSIHTRTNAVPTIRGASLDQAARNSHNMEQGRSGQPFQLPSQFHSSVPGTKTSEMDLSIGNSRKGHKESGGSGVVNFSHFARPAARARANLQTSDRSGSSSKANFVASSNPMVSTVIEPSNDIKNVVGTQGQLSLVQPSGNLIPSPRHPQEVIVVEKSKDIAEGEISKKDINHDTTIAHCRSPDRVQASSFAASASVGRQETEKGNEAVVASSSVCSGSSAGPTSNDHKHWEKQKHHEGEESGYQSEDLEGESADLKRADTVQGKSKKRSRAAEVHNLSERRRRDRINERMRALQELIPNCNKTDKASMLDEAIEYLKSLRMQVQIMSMGSGLCMSPMMMQHMRASSMAHFPPMGIGMGMGMGLGYGMGMYDMNGSPACSFIPVHPIQRPQFSCPSIPGSMGLHRVPGPSGLQMFGIPGQGVPMPMPYQPPSTSVVDTKTSPAAAVNLEMHQPSKAEMHQHSKAEDSDIK